MNSIPPKVSYTLEQWYHNQPSLQIAQNSIIALLSQMREQIDSHFFQDSLSNLFDSASLKNIQSATELLVSSLLQKKKLLIVGDYDVDGVTAVCLLERFFQEIGYTSFDTFIPNRFEHGYGLSEHTIDTILEIAPNLVITVDNGSSYKTTIKKLQEHNIQVIVTDHHEFKKENLPECLVVNPKQTDCQFPFKNLSGVGVAFYFLIETRKVLRKYPQFFLTIPNLAVYLDVVAIGTIADQVELIGINRILVKHGLRLIEKLETTYFYLQALKKKFPTQKFNSEFISFQIAPLINSAGRLEKATFALDFLNASNLFEANKSLDQLTLINQKRKAIQKLMLEKTLQQMHHETLQTVFISYDNQHHEGVIGIIANNIADQFKIPAIIFAKGKNQTLKGSARSPEKIDVLALLTKCSSLIEQYGGHQNAAGLVIQEKNFEQFKTLLQKQASIDKQPDQEEIQCDLELLPFMINFELYEKISQFEPFGQKNRKPLFLIKNIVLKNTKQFSENQHFKFQLNTCECIFWNGVKKMPKHANRFDIVFEINENTFQNQRRLQLNIKSMFDSNSSL